MKKLDFQISKITEVKDPIYYGDDFLHLYIHTEQASYIQFFCLDLFYYEDNFNELWTVPGLSETFLFKLGHLT